MFSANVICTLYRTHRITGIFFHFFIPPNTMETCVQCKGLYDPKKVDGCSACGLKVCVNCERASRALFNNTLCANCASTEDAASDSESSKPIEEGEGSSSSDPDASPPRTPPPRQKPVVPPKKPRKPRKNLIFLRKGLKPRKLKYCPE